MATILDKILEEQTKLKSVIWNPNPLSLPEYKQQDQRKVVKKNPQQHKQAEESKLKELEKKLVHLKKLQHKKIKRYNLKKRIWNRNHQIAQCHRNIANAKDPFH